MDIEIKTDDLSGPEIAQFLEDHQKDMLSVSPPESTHTLDLEALRKPDVTFWTVWYKNTLAGCGAIKELDAEHAEVKSMRTSTTLRGRGIASSLMEHVLSEAKKRGYQRLSLETGSMSFFDSARALYLKYGFEYCAPFASYQEDPNSVFMTRVLQKNAI